MTNMVEVEHLPPCDFCGKDAAYDGKTTRGPWGFMCRSDWEKHGVGKLGTGFGQRLVEVKP